jgi:hypothetical protein
LLFDKIIKMNGIVWKSRTDSVDFSLFKNFYDSLKFISRDKLVKVNLENLRKNLKNIFVIDQHFSPHSQKKSLLFTAHCVLEPLTNER